MNWRRPMVLRLPPVCVMNARKEEKSVWGSLQRERLMRAKECKAADSQDSILKGSKIQASQSPASVGHAKYIESWMHLNGPKAYGLHSPSRPSIGAGHPRFELFYVWNYCIHNYIDIK